MEAAILAFTAPVTSMVASLITFIPAMVTTGLPVLVGFMGLRIGLRLVRHFAGA